MKRAGGALEVLWVFLRLGLTSFGGPIAHLGYFRREFVEKRGWVPAQDYAGLLAMCQFLPGPASSQVGFCIGLRRAGWLGGLAAFTGFTLPSALLMVLIAQYIGQFQTSGLARGAMHGLQLAAVAVVAQAVWTMAGSLCPDTPRRAIAILAIAVLMLIPDTAGQIFVLLMGAALGRLALEPDDRPKSPEPALVTPGHRRAGALSLGICGILLIFAFLPTSTPALLLFNAFYRSGALVFGGGHVVLPMLRDAVVVPGWVPPPLFLAGYGAAQAMPGPLFTVAAFLGAVASVGPGGLAGGAIAIAGIFLPGLLLAGGMLPFWQALQHRTDIASMLRGVNAAVVGLLGAAFIALLSMSVGQHFLDGPIVLAALALLTWGHARPIMVVAFCAVAGAIL